MMTVAEIKSAVDDDTLAQLIEAEAERHRLEIMALWAHKKRIMQNTLANLKSLGVEAKLAHFWGSQPPQRGILCESYGFDANGTYRHQFHFFEDTRPGRPAWDTRLVEGQLSIWHGVHELAGAERRTVLLIPVLNTADEERGHRKAVSHLRNVARREGLRVSVRDRQVTLIDPMDTVLHTGTVVTTLAWIAGVDLDHPEDIPESLPAARAEVEAFTAEVAR